MFVRLGTRLLSLASLLISSGCVATAQSPSRQAPPGASLAVGRPSITIDSPKQDAALQGVTIIRFRAENVSIASLFVPGENRQNRLPPAHLHVTVDGADWHWVHSTSDPVVITPLPSGEHTVTLELAGADHRPLDVRSVRFTIVARPAPVQH